MIIYDKKKIAISNVFLQKLLDHIRGIVFSPMSWDGINPKRPGVYNKNYWAFLYRCINHSQLFIKENTLIPQESQPHQQAIPNQDQGKELVRDRVAEVWLCQSDISQSE